MLHWVQKYMLHCVWVQGLTFSLIIGALLMHLLDSFLDRHILKKIKNAYYDLPKEDDPRESKLNPIDVHPLIVGTIERLFFTLVVAYEVTGAAVAMVGWVTVKATIIWVGKVDKQHGQAFALRSVLCGLASMLFALIGGVIIQQGLKP